MFETYTAPRLFLSQHARACIFILAANVETKASGTAMKELTALIHSPFAFCSKKYLEDEERQANISDILPNSDIMSKFEPGTRKTG